MTDPTDRPAYQVLARKYRPQTLADLVGQQAMVRTLKNAFAADRIAQAFILTGIRGTGKTTTARIIAKGLNCVGPDGSGGPTTEPCGRCDHCTAIAEGSHVDVIEMDGASQTRIDDIRANVLDSVHYAPASARYKIYIIDEVHMLSTSAFNALLKTLEEPPPHVKFIFATTEIRKVPVTVLSRCQRFDLRRMEPEDTMAYLRRLADLEGARISDEALALITRAAEGSMRDAVSLLDQAISHGAASGAGDEVGAEQVRAMLGLADRGRILDLFEAIMRGDAAAALAELAAQYADGADPVAVLRDLAEVTHWISVVKITPEAGDDPTVPAEERRRGTDLARALGMPALSRMWQMLLKALDEVAHAPNAMMAAEMAVIRLTHVAELPTPEKLVQMLSSGPQGSGPGGGGGTAPLPAGGGGSGGPAAQVRGTATTATGTPTASAGGGSGGAEPATALAPEQALPATFEAVLELIRARRDLALLVEVENSVRLASYAPGRIEFEMAPGARPDLAARLAGRLQQWTGARWGVSVVSQGGAPTIAEQRRRQRDDLHARAREHPAVRAVLAQFPGAEIRDVRPTADQPAATAAPTDPEEGNDDMLEGWDPFEEQD